MRTGEPLPTVGDVLAAIATGLWRWDNASGRVTLDAEAARLLGLPAAPADAHRGRDALPVPPGRLRTRSTAIVQLAVAEETLAEARLRDRGRARAGAAHRPQPAPAPGPSTAASSWSAPSRRCPSRSPGTSAAHTPITGDWRRSREAFLLDAGRALAEARSTAEVLRVAAGLSMPGLHAGRAGGLRHRGRPADRSSAITASSRRRRAAVRRHVAGRPTTRPPRSSAPAGPSICPRPTTTAAATPPPGRWPPASAARPGRSCR